jgi:type II secretory pathway pseudopilin PulG
VSRSRRAALGFTLAELLVVIGVIAVLGTLTVISVQRISRDTRTATATNTVTNALAAARAHAIKTNNLVMVVFRPIWNPNQRQTPQQTEVLIAEWTGRSFEFLPGQLADVYLPANGFQPIRIAPGVKVAGPVYETGADATWATQPDMARTMGGGGVAACSEPITYSRMIGVLFGADGSLLTRNPNGATDDNKSFVDFNRVDSNGDGDPQDCQLGTCANGNFQVFWLQDHVEDESNVTLVPFLAVYDDRAARERRTQEWTGDAGLVQDLVGATGYISTSSDRIHFNRYTGVAEVIAP